MSASPPNPITALPRTMPSVLDMALLKNLRKYWATSLAVFVLVVAGTVFFTMGQKRIYEAEATVMFDPSPPRPLGSRVESVVDMGAGTYWNNQEYYETQYAILQSRRVALAVVNDQALHRDAAWLANLPEDASLPEEEGAASDQEVDPDLAAEILRGRLSVQPVIDSRLATVRYQDASPERAQRVLAAVVDTYIEQNLENALASTTSAADWLARQLDSLKTDLESSEIDLHDYKTKNDILSVAFDDKSTMLGEQLSQINHELTRVRAQLQEANARYRQLARARDDDPQRIDSHELLRSPLMGTLRADHAQALSEKKALLGENKGPKHPEVQAADARVRAAEKAILKEVDNVKRAYAADVAVLSSHAGGLMSMLDAAKKQAHEHNLLEIEYKRLNRARENTEKLYSLVLERMKESDLTRMLRVNNVSIVDRPLVPGAPVRPRVTLQLLVGLLLGLALGVGASFGRSLLDRTIKVPEDIEEGLSLTVLGLLPQSAKMKAGAAEGAARRFRGRRAPTGRKPELVVHDEPMGGVAEAARAIRTNLMFMEPDTPYETLLVTSAGPSEGKTTVACCIAITLAQAGQRVVLVDCDLRRPRIRRVFDVEATDGGLTSVLLGEPLDQSTFETSVPGLTVLPAGPVPPNPAELLHTERFKSLLDDLKGRFDRVILDSPPVVAVTDPTILSTLVDGCVLVVRANQTKKNLALHAVRSLRAVGDNVSGVVLNAVDFSRSEYAYSYYEKGAYYGRAADDVGGNDDAPTPLRESA
ncbi:MAG: polysaccharide biosynthesis tyrosine autokinase [Myxococcota bacterium]